MLLVPDAGYVDKSVEDIATMVEPDFRNLRLLAGEAQLVGIKRMMIPPRSSEGIELIAIDNPDSRSDGESLDIRCHPCHSGDEDSSREGDAMKSSSNAPSERYCDSASRSPAMLSAYA